MNWIKRAAENRDLQRRPAFNSIASAGHNDENPGSGPVGRQRPFLQVEGYASSARFARAKRRRHDSGLVAIHERIAVVDPFPILRRFGYRAAAEELPSLLTRDARQTLTGRFSLAMSQIASCDFAAGESMVADLLSRFIRAARRVQPDGFAYRNRQLVLVLLPEFQVLPRQNPSAFARSPTDSGTMRRDIARRLRARVIQRKA